MNNLKIAHKAVLAATELLEGEYVRNCGSWTLSEQEIHEITTALLLANRAVYEIPTLIRRIAYTIDFGVVRDAWLDADPTTPLVDLATSFRKFAQRIASELPIEISIVDDLPSEQESSEDPSLL